MAEILHVIVLFDSVKLFWRIQLTWHEYRFLINVHTEQHLFRAGLIDHIRVALLSCTIAWVIVLIQGLFILQVNCVFMFPLTVLRNTLLRFITQPLLSAITDLSTPLISNVLVMCTHDHELIQCVITYGQCGAASVTN